MINAYIPILLAVLGVKTSSAQIECAKDSFHITGRVSCVVQYEKANRYNYSSYINAISDNGDTTIIDSIKGIRIYCTLPETEIYIYPVCNANAKTVADHIKAKSLIKCDSFLYTYLFKQRPFRQRLKRVEYKVSRLKKWQGLYPYIDREELYTEYNDKEDSYYIVRRRTLWVDNCQYEFILYIFEFDKEELRRSYRCVKYNFKRLVKTIHISK